MFLGVYLFLKYPSIKIQLKIENKNAVNKVVQVLASNKFPHSNFLFCFFVWSQPVPEELLVVLGI